MRLIFLVLAITYTLFSCSNVGKDPVLQLNIMLLEGKKAGDVAGIRLGEKDSIQSYFVGELYDKERNRYLVIKTIHISNWSQSRRLQSYIIVYNKKKKFLGYYNVMLDTELPSRVLDNRLVFNESFCEEPSLVSFDSGVPKFINVGCQEPNFVEFLKGEKQWITCTSYSSINHTK